MLLSYFVGQKKYPIKYPLKDIAVYVVSALAIFALMTFSNARLALPAALSVNTVLLLAFCILIIKRDLPLSSIPVIGRFFRKG